MEKQFDTFLKFVRAHLWQRPLHLKDRSMSHEEFTAVMQVAKEQAMTSILAQGIIESGIRLERNDIMEMVSFVNVLEQKNLEMDRAVVWLCKTMKERNVRIWVFKGQTLARLYPIPKARSCGDIDFLVHPDDWPTALHYFKDELNLSINDMITEKDVSFHLNGVVFEMHRNLTAFASSRHSRYWKRKVMPAIFKSGQSVNINDYPVPTLPPTYNVLYVFVHIFEHLISDGIGLRQFCDWMLLMHSKGSEVDTELLNRHLEGIGLYKAFHGVGAVLTNYLGYVSDSLKLSPTKKDEKHVISLIDNIFEFGNFGNNKEYKNKPGVKHGIEHLGRIVSQSRKFGHYARLEVWSKVPYMFRWWSKKIYKIVTKKHS